MHIIIYDLQLAITIAVLLALPPSLISRNNCYSAGDKTISSSMQMNYILNTEY